MSHKLLKGSSILLADDHALVRAGIRALVERLPGVKVVAEAKDGFDALNLVRIHNPDLVLMELAMPHMNGLEATRRISQEFPAVRVIILSMYASQENVREAINAGAMGYLVKRGAVAELEQAITALAQGKEYFSPLVLTYLDRERAGRLNAQQSSIDRLTPRQLEVLQLIAQGQNSKEIASTLKISIKTVETHRAQRMDRLGIHDVPGPLRAGLVSLDERREQPTLAQPEKMPPQGYCQD